MQLWIEKYKPAKLWDFVGNRKTVEELRYWVSTFKLGEGLLITGGTGVGKSLLVESMAYDSGALLVQINANEASTETIQEIIKSSKTTGIFQKKKIILVDEVDSFSGRDRGIMGEVAELIKQSKFPVILICSDPYSQKLKTIKQNCVLLKFDKIPSPSISKRLGDICREEGVEADKDALNTLSKFCQGDLRSAITDLQIACLGKKNLLLQDLEALGYREREQSVFSTLQPIFHSRSLSAGRNAIQNADKDSDEIFWWIENNILLELKTEEEIAEGYDLLSHADIMRGRTMKQQNWRFKAIASDLISGISILKKSHTGFVMYRPQQRFIQLGKSKAKRAEIAELSKELGLHCSTKKIAQEYLPYMKIFEKLPERRDLKTKIKGVKNTESVQEKKTENTAEAPQKEIKTEKPKIKTLFNF